MTELGNLEHFILDMIMSAMKCYSHEYISYGTLFHEVITFIRKFVMGQDNEMMCVLKRNALNR